MYTRYILDICSFSSYLSFPKGVSSRITEIPDMLDKIFANDAINDRHEVNEAIKTMLIGLKKKHGI